MNTASSLWSKRVAILFMTSISSFPTSCVTENGVETRLAPVNQGVYIENFPAAA